MTATAKKERGVTGSAGMMMMMTHLNEIGGMRVIFRERVLT